MIVSLSAVLETDRDRDFILALYERYFGLMKKCAYDITRDASVAEDLVHDAFLKLIDKRETLRPLECHKLTAYIVYTIRSVALNYAVRSKRIDKHRIYMEDGDYSNFVQDTYTPEQSAMDSDWKEAFDRYACRLSQRDRDLLFFKYILEMSDKDIAAAIGVKHTSMTQLVARAKKRARIVWQREMGESNGEK